EPMERYLKPANRSVHAAGERHVVPAEQDAPGEVIGIRSGERKNDAKTRRRPTQCWATNFCLVRWRDALIEQAEDRFNRYAVIRFGTAAGVCRQLTEMVLDAPLQRSIRNRRSDLECPVGQERVVVRSRRVDVKNIVPI